MTRPFHYYCSLHFVLASDYRGRGCVFVGSSLPRMNKIESRILALKNYFPFPGGWGHWRPLECNLRGKTTLRSDWESSGRVPSAWRCSHEGVAARKLGPRRRRSLYRLKCTYEGISNTRTLEFRLNRYLWKNIIFSNIQVILPHTVIYLFLCTLKLKRKNVCTYLF